MANEIPTFDDLAERAAFRLCPESYPHPRRNGPSFRAPCNAHSYQAREALTAAHVPELLAVAEAAQARMALYRHPHSGLTPNEESTALLAALDSLHTATGES